MIFGFFVMGLLAVRTYTDAMPQPERVVDEQGRIVFTGADITSGQQIFLRRGLQQYGSIVGHGGYLGPDYTADYLRRSALLIERANLPWVFFYPGWPSPVSTPSACSPGPPAI
jgi:nitric oxide reductase subunit B